MEKPVDKSLANSHDDVESLKGPFCTYFPTNIKTVRRKREEKSSKGKKFVRMPNHNQVKLFVVN